MSDENMLFATEEEQAAELDKKELNETVTKKYLTFQTDNLMFGIEAESVIEIITNSYGAGLCARNHQSARTDHPDH